MEGDEGFKYAELSDDLISKEIKDDAIKSKGYFIYPSQIFSNIAKNANTNESLNTDLAAIFSSIESSAIGYPSEQEIKGLFADFDTTSNRLGNTVKDKNSRLAAVIKGVEGLKLGDFEENQIDLFGDAYEFLISNYAANAGKSGGEFFTPQCVSKLIAKLAIHNQDKINKIYDPAAGSATTAHAVMELNAEDGGNRKFIMVQLPEETDEKSEAYKAGYKNICEIGKERIRRAGEKIKEDNKDKEGIENLDTGFRVLKLDDTNMKDVYYRAEDYTQNLLDRFESNIKDDRDDLDLLFGCLLDWGLPLDRPYESIDINGNKIHIYNNGDLVACFDDEILEETVKEIAKMEALRVVFRDSSFTNDPERINIEEIFKLLSPDTSIRVISGEGS